MRASKKLRFFQTFLDLEPRASLEVNVSMLALAKGQCFPDAVPVSRKYKKNNNEFYEISSRGILGYIDGFNDFLFLTWGNDPNLTFAYFYKGLVNQPPTIGK